MARPRSEIVDVSKTPYYHIMSRCVRRAYLYGKDVVTGKDYSHRKQWIVDRIKRLSQAFAIDICSYAAMSNHYHLVVHIDTHRLASASEKELLMRLEMVFPKDAKAKMNALTMADKAGREAILQELRAKLSDLSKFMFALNNYIAKACNKEDKTDGRFWDNRFQSQALLDDGAILSAMAYVDLNPIRANMANTPEASEFTSIQERIKYFAKGLRANQQDIEKTCQQSKQPETLMPFKQRKHVNDTKNHFIDFQLSDYIQLVEETGRIIRDDKAGAIPNHLAPIIERIGLTKKGWLSMVQELERRFYYAVGNIVHLAEWSAAYRNVQASHCKYAGSCYLEMDA